jgi:hypothetical protein
MNKEQEDMILLIAKEIQDDRDKAIIEKYKNVKRTQCLFNDYTVVQYLGNDKLNHRVTRSPDGWTMIFSNELNAWNCAGKIEYKQLK